MVVYLQDYAWIYNIILLNVFGAPSLQRVPQLHDYLFLSLTTLRIYMRIFSCDFSQIIPEV